MKNFICVALLAFLVNSFLNAELTPREIMEKCIKRHGGEENFKKIKNIYIKMDIKSKSDQADVESLVEQYFRFPDKLRAEIQSMVNPPTKISWDGSDAWQETKGVIEKTSDEKQKERLKESLRFVNLIMLTNLLETGSELKYQKLVKRKTYGIHVIDQTNLSGEKITLYIRDDDYSLFGGEFYWKETDSIFKVFLDKQDYWVDDVCIPREARLYRGDEKVLEASVRLVKINALKNGNSFFSNLNEEAKMIKKGRN